MPVALLKTLVGRQIAAAERQTGVPLPYLRHIAQHALSAYFKALALIPLGRHRKSLPVDLFHAARIVATQFQDCGSCVQTAVNLARRDGLSADYVLAMLKRENDRLPEQVREAIAFSTAVVERNGQDAELRDRIRARYGEEAVVELALAIATVQVYPLLKRGLGFAGSCVLTQIDVEGSRLPTALK